MTKTQIINKNSRKNLRTDLLRLTMELWSPTDKGTKKYLRLNSSTEIKLETR